MLKTPLHTDTHTHTHTHTHMLMRTRVFIIIRYEDNTWPLFLLLAQISAFKSHLSVCVSVCRCV